MGANSEFFIQLQSQAANEIEAAINGEVSYLDVAISLTETKKACENIIEQIKAFESEYAQRMAQDAQDYGGAYKGYEFKYVNGRVMYDYKAIPEWVDAERQKKEIEAKYKSMFEAKAKGVNGADLDPETGELLPLPEVNYGKSYLTIKKK